MKNCVEYRDKTHNKLRDCEIKDEKKKKEKEDNLSTRDRNCEYVRKDACDRRTESKIGCVEERERRKEKKNEHYTCEKEKSKYSSNSDSVQLEKKRTEEMRNRYNSSIYSESNSHRRNRHLQEIEEKRKEKHIKYKINEERYSNRGALEGEHSAEVEQKELRKHLKEESGLENEKVQIRRSTHESFNSHEEKGEKREKGEKGEKGEEREKREEREEREKREKREEREEREKREERQRFKEEQSSDSIERRRYSDSYRRKRRKEEQNKATREELKDGKECYTLKKEEKVILEDLSNPKTEFYQRKSNSTQIEDKNKSEEAALTKTVKKEKLNEQKLNLSSNPKEEEKPSNENRLSSSSLNGKDVQKNFEISGMLAAETNIKNGITLKYSLPSDSARPKMRWRLYMFKREDEEVKNLEDQEPSKVYHIHRQCAYLFGKESRVCDVLLMHPTISKQHAVLTFRNIKKADDAIPYIMDLESTNGTFLNSEKIESCRFYELKELDTLRFGRSTRDFVLLHSNSVNVTQIHYQDLINQ